MKTGIALHLTNSKNGSMVQNPAAGNHGKQRTTYQY
jgi:hypothetical protein